MGCCRCLLRLDFHDYILEVSLNNLRLPLIDRVLTEQATSLSLATLQEGLLDLCSFHAAQSKRQQPTI
jgi:hypothetical protein